MSKTNKIKLHEYSNFNFTRTLCSLWLIVIFSYQVSAGESAGQAGGFLRIGLGPRAKGMGDTYTAVADNAFAPYYNPAGLGFLKSREIGLSYGILSFDRTLNYLGFVSPLRPNAGFALGVLQSGFRESDVRTATGETTGEKIQDVQYAVFLGFAIRIDDRFSIGIAPKLIYSKVFDVSASSVGVDLGMMYKPDRRLTLGLSIKEIGQSLRYSRDATGFGEETTKDKLPTVTKFGAAYDHPLGGTFKNILIVYDLELNSAQSSKMHFGIEANILDKFFLRTGLDGGDWTAGFSIPLTIKEKRFRLDYAYIRDTRSGAGNGTQDLAIAFVF